VADHNVISTVILSCLASPFRLHELGDALQGRSSTLRADRREGFFWEGRRFKPTLDKASVPPRLIVNGAL